MKHRKSSSHRKFHSLPKLRFDEITLTSFAGLLLYYQLFKRIALKQHLRNCFRHLPGKPTFGAAVILLQLIIHVLLGYRQLRHQAYYQNDYTGKREPHIGEPGCQQHYPSAHVATRDGSRATTPPVA